MNHGPRPRDTINYIHKHPVLLGVRKGVRVRRSVGSRIDKCIGPANGPEANFKSLFRKPLAGSDGLPEQTLKLLTAFPNRPAAMPEEIAGLAERRGYPFEAIMFLTAAIAGDGPRRFAGGPASAG